MRTVYIIFSYVGWAWFAAAMALLWWRTHQAGAPGLEGAGNDAQ